jgi:hypothetical protein
MSAGPGRGPIKRRAQEPFVELDSGHLRAPVFLTVIGGSDAQQQLRNTPARSGELLAELGHPKDERDQGDYPALCQG